MSGTLVHQCKQRDDCNDNDILVHPGQEEFRCDRLDDNCDGAVDESFDVNGACTDAFQCPGTKACSNGGVACTNTVPPTAYYRDEDGDGRRARMQV